jgi:hypothetical protein
MKWYADAIGAGEIAQHLVRLMSRAEARGLFVSGSGYTTPAIATTRDFLQHKLIALSILEELVHVLNEQADLTDFLVKKMQAAQSTKTHSSIP